MSDQTIVCATCGEAFVFPASEQAFYAERGLAPPKRCKPCRHARKTRSGVSFRFGQARLAGADAEQVRYPIRCSECGVAAEVPFKPIAGRPVFCAACHRARKGLVRQATDGVEVDPSDEGIIE